MIIAFFYAAGARLHRAFMRRRAAARGRLACAVVSVGALTVGGAGKTPVAARLAAGLAARGHRVALASRGYKGASKARVLLVSDGARIHASVEDAGDEALVLAAHAPGVPVLVGRDRRVVGHHAVSVFDCQILVLDDGFQHHRVAKDLEILCVDGASGFGNGRVLPAGPLREPLSALAHADWLCLVDRGGLDSRGGQIERRYGAGRTCLHVGRRPVALVGLDRRDRVPIAELAGRRLGLLAGIARPGSFRATLEGLGASVVRERLFPDHHRYREEDCRGLSTEVDYWVTTEKDAIKILPAWIRDVRLLVLQIEAEIEDEADVLGRIEAHLRAAGRLA